jgi:PAS domain-containing protein
MSTSTTADPSIAANARASAGAGHSALRALPLPYLLLGHDGRVGDADLSPYNPATTIKPGVSLDTALSIPFETLIDAARSDRPKPLPALLYTETMPTLVLAQPVRLADGLLVLIISLDALQAAEQQKFERTPYGVVRLGLDGRVDFANPAALRLWSMTELVGQRFVDLLPERFRDEFVVKLGEVLDTKTSRSIRLTSGAAVLIGTHKVHSEPRLTLLPEFLDGSTLRGVQIVIREGIINALRVALREAALETAKGGSAPKPDGPHGPTWRDRTRRMLDLLRDVLPHDLAIISEVSGSAEWIRPILMHPEPPNHWPRMWWRMSREELAQFDAGPYREELTKWMKSNPDRHDEPLLKLLREVRPGGKPLESFAIVPIRPNGRTEAVLTLASTQPRRFEVLSEAGTAGSGYDDEEELPRDPLAVLDRLGLDTLLLMMLRRARREAEAAQRTLVANIEAAETVPDAVLILLRELVRHFGWDHAAAFIAHHPEGAETMPSRDADPHADAEELQLFAQFPETENEAEHPLAIPKNYTQPLYDPRPGEEFDEARALESGMLGAAIRNARRGNTGVLVASDVTKLDDAGRPPHWFRSVGEKPRSALTIAITINGRTRWVLDTVSRQPNAFIEEDGDHIAPLVKGLAARISQLREYKLNERLIDLIDKAVLITDDAGVILRANPRARELLGLPPLYFDRRHHRLIEFVHGPNDAGLPGPHQTEAKLSIGPKGGKGVETHVRRLEDMTRTSDIIWLLSGADRQTYNVETRYIAETVQEVARQVRAPLLLAATLAKQLGHVSLQDTIAPLAKQVREGIAKADITFERLAEAQGALRDPKREERIVPLKALLDELCDTLPGTDRDRLRLDTASEAEVSGDRGRLAYALRTLLGYMLSRDTSPISIKLRHLSLQAEIELSGAEIEQSAKPEDAVRAAALEAAADAQDSVRAVLLAHGGGLERTTAGFQIHVPLAHDTEASP